MPTFETKEPIAVTVDLAVGDIRVVASDRADTVVEVRPTHPARKADVKAAEQTVVEFSAGRLLIKAPRGWRYIGPSRGSASIDVEIGLPAGSALHGDAAVTTLSAVGRLGECRFKTSAGDIRIAEAGAVRLKTAAGDISVEVVHGSAELTTSSGALRVEYVDGDAIVKNSNGEIRVGEVTGDLQVNAANGGITVGRAHAGVGAKTANGNVRLGEVMRGSVSAQTARGNVEIGVREGVAAWLDLDTSFGVVHNNLDAAARPDAQEETVELRVRTSFGNITVARALVNTDRSEA